MLQRKHLKQLDKMEEYLTTLKDVQGIRVNVRMQLRTIDKLKRLSGVHHEKAQKND